ncbi:MAG: hypothetical protein HYT87_03620 [Nitrospirae bacterium]|nr:hypothetical protein [Nitrospirota bacterium]
MQDFGQELRAIRKVLWVLAALWLVQIILSHGTVFAPGSVVAEEPENTVSVDIVKIAGHTIVGRKLPVETQE